MEVGKSRVKIIVLISIIVLVVLIAISVAVNATGNSSGIAKSITFTDNMDGAYVYVRAVDVAGNKGEWSEPQRLWIDNTAPTVTANESSVTIKEGDVNALADYFTVVSNGTNADIDVVCTIGGVEYEDTESLTADGSPYTVVCTASKNGGKSNSAEMEIVVEPAFDFSAVEYTTWNSSDIWAVNLPEEWQPVVVSVVRFNFRFSRYYFFRRSYLE